MWPFVCFTIAVAAHAAWKLALSVRSQLRAHRLRALFSGSLATAIAFALGAVLSIISKRPVDSDIGLILAACFIACAMLARSAARVPGIELYRSVPVAVRNHWEMRRRARRESTAATLTRFLAIAAPPGGHGVTVPKRLTFERVLFRLMGFMIALSFVLSPLLVAVAVIGSFGAEKSPMSLFAPALVQYATLLVAACWSIALIATWLTLVFGRLIGAISWRFDLIRYFSTVAAVSGIGLVVGASVAVLLPVVASSGIFSMPSSEALPIDGARPDLLLTATGTGGVLGFLVGQLIAVSTLMRTLPNMFCGTLAAPAIFLAWSTIFSFGGLTPGATLDRITALLRGRVAELNPTATAEAATTAFREDWRTLLLFISDSARDWFPDAGWFIAITGTCTLIAAVGVFIWEFHHRPASQD